MQQLQIANSTSQHSRLARAVITIAVAVSVARPQLTASQAHTQHLIQTSDYHFPFARHHDNGDVSAEQGRPRCRGNQSA